MTIDLHRLPTSFNINELIIQYWLLLINRLVFDDRFPYAPQTFCYYLILPRLREASNKYAKRQWQTESWHSSSQLSHISYEACFEMIFTNWLIINTFTNRRSHQYYLEGDTLVDFLRVLISRSRRVNSSGSLLNNCMNSTFEASDCPCSKLNDSLWLPFLDLGDIDLCPAMLFYKGYQVEQTFPEIRLPLSCFHFRGKPEVATLFDFCPNGAISFFFLNF